MKEKGRRWLALLTALALVAGTAWTPQSSRTAYASAGAAGLTGTDLTGAAGLTGAAKVADFTNSAGAVDSAGMACGCNAEALPAGEEGFTAGDGSADLPYEIHTARQLSHIRAHLDGNYFVLAEEIDLAEYCTTEESNPDRTQAGGMGWKPIGGDGITPESKAFTGVLDGKGHSIANLTIRAATADKDGSQAYGLFGTVKNSAKIMNLVIKNPQIEISGNKSVEAGAAVGLSKASGVPLKNVFILGGSLRGLGTGAHRLGGVLGSSQDARATISNCYADIEISSQSQSADSRLGGIMGGSSGKNEGFEACLYTGAITKTAGTAGGISGDGGTLTNCWYDTEKVAQDSGTGTDEPAQDSGTGTDKSVQDSGTGTDEPAQDSGAGTDKPAQDSGTGTDKPTQDNGTGTDEPVLDNDSEIVEPGGGTPGMGTVSDAEEGGSSSSAEAFTGKYYRITVKTAAPLFGNRVTDRYQKSDYDVKLALTGNKGQSGWITINPYDHTVTPLSGQEDVYEVALADIGRLNGVKYYSDIPNGNKLADWYIDWIQVDELDGESGKVVDNNTVSVRNYVVNPQVNEAKMAYRYDFTVKTGSPLGAGTDSNIYVRLIGGNGEMTEEREISGLVRGNAFERNSTDTCSVYFDRSIGTITGLQIRSDCALAASDWFVDSIRVDKYSKTGSSVGASFTLNQWIADTSPKTFRAGTAGAAAQYRLTVKTGNGTGAGTDSNIYVRLTGDKGTTEEREISELVNGNAFEKGNTDTLIATFDKNVGNIKKLELRSDMSWASADWQVESIGITPVSAGAEGTEAVFQIGQWITDKAWKTFSNDPADSTQYKFTVKTGNAMGAGTDSNIYVRLIGSKGTTNEIEISELVSGNAFEKGKTDTFMASFDKNVGTIQKLQLRSDMKWAGAEWLLDSIKIEPVYKNQVQNGGKTFQINQWIQDKNTLTYSVDGKSITQYRFTVKTGKLSWFPKGEGTDSNIYVKLVGSAGTTNEVEISELVSGNAFERGNKDTCNVVFQNDIGTLQKIQIRSDMKWAGADWYVEYIQVQPLLNGQNYGSAKTFHFNQWIDSKNIYEKQ